MAKKKDKDPKLEDENINEEAKDDISDADESFGLPDIDYEPIDRDAPEETSEEPEEAQEEEELDMETVPSDFDEGEDSSASSEFEPKKESRAPMIVAVVVIVLGVIGGLGYFMGWFDFLGGSEEPQETVQEPVQEPVVEEPVEEPVVEEPVEEEPVDVAPEPGAITTLTEPTSRYYVIIASSVDGDLANDYAKKLSGEGMSPTIIPPFGSTMFYRTALQDFDSFAEAQSKADELKATYGDGLWVLKY